MYSKSPGILCLTPQWYFLDGTHFVKTMQPVVIKNVENFTMKGSNKFALGLEDICESSSKIECVGTHRI